MSPGPSPAAIPEALLTDAPAHLVAAPETDVVVELMGGDEPARTLIAAALSAGKPVVTANKHVLAHHGPELEAIARRTGAALRFEAAVGGGIPVLGPIALDLAANRISAVRGIVNGTTNFILCAMASEGRAYADVLADAQRAGYAEADPRGDVEGDDAANKLVVLARQAFGRWLDVSSISRIPEVVAGGLGLPGITGVTIEDIAAAAARGFAIKLVASRAHGRMATCPRPSCRRRSRSTRPSAGPTASSTGSRSTRRRSVGSPSPDRAPVGRRPRRPCSAISSPSRAAPGSTWAGLAAAAGSLRASRLAAAETFDAPSGARYQVIR